MTDPYAASADPGPGSQADPRAPRTDGAQPPENLPLAGPPGAADPWSSGPGLGWSADTGSVADLDATPTPPSAPAWPTQATGPYAQPAPAPQTSYQQPPYAAAYPEPDGPANQIGNPYSAYAPSAYAGQRLPAITDPVAYDYGYSHPQGATAHPQAAASMVLGILGLVVFSPLAPVAWYLAAKARREMNAEPFRWQPSGMVTAGMVLGIVGTVIMALFALLFVLVFVLAAFSS